MKKMIKQYNKIKTKNKEGASLDKEASIFGHRTVPLRGGVDACQALSGVFWNMFHFWHGY